MLCSTFSRKFFFSPLAQLDSKGCINLDEIYWKTIFQDFYERARKPVQWPESFRVPLQAARINDEAINIWFRWILRLLFVHRGRVLAELDQRGWAGHVCQELQADCAWKRRKRNMMELFGIISDRPRNCCCGLTCVLPVARNRESTQLADTHEIRAMIPTAPKWRRHCK